MNVVVVLGQAIGGITGIILGVILFQKWFKSRNRSTIHFAVFLLASGAYLLSILIDLGYCNAELLSRILYAAGIIGLYVGVFPGILLLLPSRGRVIQVTYQAVPSTVFVVVLLVVLLVPMHQVETGIFQFNHPYHLVFVRLLHGVIALLAIGSLLYLSFRVRDLRPAIMALGFMCVMVGMILMGSFVQTVGGSLLQALGTTAYVSLVALIFWRGNQWFGKMNPYLGPVLVLTLLVISAIICALIVFAKPFLLWQTKKPKKALKLVAYTAGWLVLFFFVTLGVLLII